MPAKGPGDLTLLLQQWGRGDREALSKLMELVYPELRRIARSHIRRERPDHTLQPTALVSEAYLKLLDQRKLEWRSRGHLLAVVSTLMRRILVDYARARRADKRGGQALRVTIEGLDVPSPSPAVDLIAVDDALSKLEKLHPRKAQVVELRFFAGLSHDEIATHLQIGLRTVERDWAFACSWLGRELERG